MEFELFKGLLLGSGFGLSGVSVCVVVVVVDVVLGFGLFLVILVDVVCYVEGVVCGIVYFDNVVFCIVGGIVFIFVLDLLCLILLLVFEWLWLVIYMFGCLVVIVDVCVVLF